MAGYLANIPKLKAREKIEDGKVFRNLKSTDFQVVYNLYLAAFEDEALADKAKLEFLQQRISDETEIGRNQ